MENILLIEEGALEAMHKKFTDILMWGFDPDEEKKTPEEKYRDTLKWAVIKRPEFDYQDLEFMSEEDGKVYERDRNTYESPIMPLKEITNFEFIRWGRPMDL